MKTPRFAISLFLMLAPLAARAATLEQAAGAAGYFEQRAAVARALASMDAGQVEAAIDELGRISPSAFAEFVRPLLWMRLGELTGLGAIDKTDATASDEKAAARRGWARADAEAAWDWTMHREYPPPVYGSVRPRIPPDPHAQRNQELARLAGVLLEEGEGDFVLSRLLETTDPALRRSLMEADGRLGRRALLGQYERDRLISLAEDPPAGFTRQELLEFVARAWAQREPREAIAWVRSIDDLERSAILRQILRTWRTFTNDMEAVAIFLLGQPPGRDLDATLHEASRDRGLALSLGAGLVERIIDPAERDPGYKQLAERIMTAQPHMAATWAALIEDSEMRLPILGDALSRWKNEDFEAAREFLQTHPRLSETDRARLSPALQSGPRR
jgi:hypothetical protein